MICQRNTQHADGKGFRELVDEYMNSIGIRPSANGFGELVRDMGTGI